MHPLALQALGLSLEIALMSVLLCTLPSLGLAHWMARSTWRGKVLLDALVLLPLGLPPVVIGLGLWMAFAPASEGAGWLPGVGLAPWVFQPAGALAAACAVTLPTMVRLLRPAFEAQDASLVPLARSLGASPLQAWRTITLPLLLPALLSAMALGGAVAWGESGASWLLAAHLPGTLAADHTAPVALLHALRTPGQLDVARDIAVASLLVGGVSVLLSEALRGRWQRRLTGHGWRGPAT